MATPKLPASSKMKMPMAGAKPAIKNALKGAAKGAAKGAVKEVKATMKKKC